MTFDDVGYQTTGRLWIGSLFCERGIKAIVGAVVTEVRSGDCSYIDLDDNKGDVAFDYAMLFPPVAGVPLSAVGLHGEDLNEQVFAPNGMMKVDVRYGSRRSNGALKTDLTTYQSPCYDNIYAVGIVFALPHPISESRTAPDGTVITPAPSRTEMPSGGMAIMVAKTITERVNGKTVKEHNGSMVHVGAACVASTSIGRS